MADNTINTYTSMVLQGEKNECNRNENMHHDDRSMLYTRAFGATTTQFHDDSNVIIMQTHCDQAIPTNFVVIDVRYIIQILRIVLVLKSGNAKTLEGMSENNLHHKLYIQHNCVSNFDSLKNDLVVLMMMKQSLNKTDGYMVKGESSHMYVFLHSHFLSRGLPMITDHHKFIWFCLFESFCFVG